MKYLCAVYFEQKTWDALSDSEHATVIRDSIAFNEELRQSGHYIASNALQPVSAATTVRVRGGKVSTTDGPFAETKEHMGGFILVNARDLNEALQIAAKIPMAKVGSIEVRPVLELV